MRNKIHSNILFLNTAKTFNIQVITLILTFFLLASLHQIASAQQTDSLRTTLVDTAQVDSVMPPQKFGKIKHYFNKDYPNPRKAALFSAIIPGAGQVYNRRWWKLPLVYGAIAGMTAWTVGTARIYFDLRDNYKWLVDKDPNTNPTEEPYVRFDGPQLQAYRDEYRKKTERLYVLSSLTYLLIVADAFVDAHLKQFDVSEDLSLRFVPDTKSVLGLGLTFGVGVQLKFGNAHP